MILLIIDTCLSFIINNLTYLFMRIENECNSIQYFLYLYLGILSFFNDTIKLL